MLLFKKKFIGPILQGEKTQTIRLWKYRRLKAGQRSYIPGVGYIRITMVDVVELAELTDADAVPDGFLTADALRSELRDLYPTQIDSGHQAYRVVFEVLPPDEQEKAKTERAATKREKRIGP